MELREVLPAFDAAVLARSTLLNQRAAEIVECKKRFKRDTQLLRRRIGGLKRARDEAMLQTYKEYVRKSAPLIQQLGAHRYTQKDGERVVRQKYQKRLERIEAAEARLRSRFDDAAELLAKIAHRIPKMKEGEWYGISPRLLPATPAPFQDALKGVRDPEIRRNLATLFEPLEVSECEVWVTYRRDGREGFEDDPVEADWDPIEDADCDLFDFEYSYLSHGFFQDPSTVSDWDGDHKTLLTKDVKTHMVRIKK